MPSALRGSKSRPDGCGDGVRAGSERSWNRSEPTGYKVVRVRFKDGRPDESYENFVTGFWVSGQHRAEVWRRPAALAIMKDGSLLIADDTGGTIWRVSYTGPRARTSDSEPTTGAIQR